MAVLRTYQQYIDGKWTDAVSGATFESENPTFREPWAVAPDSGKEDIDLAVAAARRAFESEEWRTSLPQYRARLLRRLAALVEKYGPDIAEIETQDNGKLITEQRLQWMLAAELLYYWAGMADKIDGRMIAAPLPLPVKNLPIPESFVYTRREPVGVVAAITPWNSPGGQLLYKLGPAIAAGCTIVAKPSEHTPASALEIAKLVDKAEFPAGVFNVVTSQDREAGAALVAHPDVHKVSFTGSTATGKAIVRAAADNMKRVTCELGGKSASLVFDDADIPTAVKGVMAGIFAAAGQTCMAGSRVLVHEDIHDSFVAALADAAQSMVIGDPIDPATQMGPISNRQNYEKVMGYLEVAEDEGARILCGGPHETLGGYYIKPTIVTNVTNSMRIAREEIFGPVASIIRFNSEEEAIAIANDTEYGLGGAVFTQSIARAHRVAHRLRTGSVWINTYRLVTHMAPFGGYKESGWGREGSLEGLDAFLETKAVWTPVE
ncbi:aldehyde dehydrogenase [Hyphococcus sp.]|uniref:aldehyde dehydrogenase n=1 Tax=Hyphococcus sp. TaxID=2038636 RepID=UPI0035C70261